MKKLNLTILAIILIFVKEIAEEINFIKQNPKCILLLGTITGIIPSIACGILFKIFGF